MRYYAGVDIGGTFVKIGVCDENGTLLSKTQIPTCPENHVSVVAQRIYGAVLTVASEAGITIKDISSIGVSVPGIINKETGECVFAGNLGWTNFPIAGELAKISGKPAYILNDANAAALGENICGAAAGYNSSILITLGTGVGGGVVINGKLLEGMDGAAGEIGHMVIVKDGEPCSCGKKGCFETYASASALIRMAKAALAGDTEKRSALWKLCDGNVNDIDGAMITDAVKRYDELSVRIWDNYTDYLAEGTSNLINIFNPDAVIFGGGVSKAEELLIQNVKPKIYEKMFAGNYMKKPEIITAKLGNDAGMIGAALFAEEKEETP